MTNKTRPSVPPTPAQYTGFCGSVLQAAGRLRSAAGIYGGHRMPTHCLTVAAHCERLCEMLRSLLPPGDIKTADSELKALLEEKQLDEPAYTRYEEGT